VRVETGQAFNQFHRTQNKELLRTREPKLCLFFGQPSQQFTDAVSHLGRQIFLEFGAQSRFGQRPQLGQGFGRLITDGKVLAIQVRKQPGKRLGAVLCPAQVCDSALPTSGS
jgi:hypothetical protein